MSKIPWILPWATLDPNMITLDPVIGTNISPDIKVLCGWDPYQGILNFRCNFIYV